MKQRAKPQSQWAYAILAGLGAGIGFVLLAQMIVALARLLLFNAL